MNGTCIFCQSYGPLTKEHIFANWLRNYVPRSRAFTSHGVRIRSVEADGLWHTQTKKGALHNSGDPHSRGIKALCAICNNVILGDHQDRCKPVIVPLITDKWQTLTHDEQMLAASWITMTSLVLMHVDPELDVNSSSSRKSFIQSLTPFDSWTIWIGRFDGSHSGTHNYLAAGSGQNKTGKHGPNADTGLLSFTVGKLVVSVFTTPLNTGSARQNDADWIARNFNLVCIWPPTSEFNIPVRVYAEDWEDPISTLSGFLGLPAQRVRIQL